MTRMSRSPIISLTLACLGLALFTGCGPDAKDQKIQELTAENDQLKGELDQRDRAMNDALVREGDARATIQELNQQLAALRNEQGKLKEIDGWISTPGFDMISIPGEVLFSSGKADLTSGGQSTVAKLASDIRARYMDRDIFVFGHTDNEPIRKSKWKDNWELGAHRALTVIRSLESQGIPGASLIQANCGEERPRSSNAASAGKAQNRRVEFYAVRRDAGITNTTASRGELE